MSALAPSTGRGAPASAPDRGAGVSAPACAIGAPTPMGTTTQSRAEQLFAGLAGAAASTVLSPRLYPAAPAGV